MDYDLDSLLNSQLSSDDDDGNDNGDVSSFRHRTVDEILDDSDSSASPPSSPPPDRRVRPSAPKVSAGASLDGGAKPTRLEESVVGSRSRSLARLKSGETASSSSPEDFLRRTSKPLPFLFAGVRSNAKPGAALAAAAAASRSVPSPHAAAIKSRRINFGREGLGKILDAEELCTDSSIDSSTVNARSVEDGRVDKADALSLSSVADTCGEDLRIDETVESALEAKQEIQGSLEVSVETQTVTLPVNNLKDADFDESYDSESRNLRSESSSADENAGETDKSPILVDTGDDSELVCSYSPASLSDINHSRESTEDLANPELETGVSLSNDDEDIKELVEERIGHLESKRVSKRAEKKKLRPRMKPLEMAEELEKKYSSAGLHWEEGAAAQPMRLEGVRRGSIALGYFEVDANNVVSRIFSSPSFRRDYGSPQVLTVHANYIAVGMARGVIVVMPSKYSAHKADEMDSKMIMMLGLQGETTNEAVTSVCFNQLGNLLLAGYNDGHVRLWDVQSKSAKFISRQHKEPVVHALFLEQDSRATRQFKAVTGDTKGLVALHTFSVIPLLNLFSNSTEWLLDGLRTGTVLSASPLLFDELPGVVGGDASRKLSNKGSSLVKEGVVIFATHQNALVVRLGSNLEVYAQLTRPEGVREGSMPYTAWKCLTRSQRSTDENVPTETLEQVSLLAIAWDRKVQVAKLANSELKIYAKWSLDCAAIGIAWLDDQLLVILTDNGQLYLCGNDGAVIHQTSFSVDGTPRDDLVSYHTHFSNIFGNPEKAYHNCVAVRGASIYILGQAHLIVSRLLPWKERIQALRKGGDWMGSLNMAMTIYDGQAHGVVDLPRTLDAVHEAIMPYLVELLLAYVEEVFSYISVAFCNQIEKVDTLDQPGSKTSSVHHEIKEQYTRVGGVAVEFCVHIKKTDILFDEIYPKFLAVKQKDTFLELLEPYILRDMLGSLPPEIMQALVEHYSSKGWLQRIEQCVLHMDISSLDFNQVVKLCQEHGLYGALIYIFNKGLDDFRAPLEELLAVLQNSEGEAAAALGYRILVYLKYCFSGLSFPPGHGKLQPSRVASLREELLQFLLENSVTLSSKAGSRSSSSRANLNLYLLLELDTEATLDVVRCAFEEAEVPPTDSSQKSADANVAKRNSVSTSQSPYLLIQNTVDALIGILNKEISQSDGSSLGSGGESVKGWLSKKEIGYLYEFIAHYVACEKANVSKRVLSQMVEYLTSEDFAPSESEQGLISKRREKQVLALLKVAPETAWDASYVLQLCEKAHFYQVCGMIHKMRRQYLAALDSYMKDVDEPIHAFSFIYSTLLKLSDNDRTAFQLAVINRISELVVLNREGTFFLVVDQFNHDVSDILSELRTHPTSLFLYLKAAVEVHLTGSLNFDNLIRDGKMSLKDNCEELEAFVGRISDFPKLLRNSPINLTDEMIELYLELLCQYEPDSVLKFLETFDSYRVEHCLRLCQEHGIIDAASFLLERVGDVGSALLLTLSSLNSKFPKLADSVGSGTTGVEHFRSSKLPEVKEIEGILNACIGLCQRNTPRLNPEESEMLWFRLLDSFCEPMMSSFGDERSSEGGHPNGILTRTFGQQNDENKESIIKWKIPRSHKCAHILKKIFSQFITEIVEGMIGYVRLPTIMSKLLADSSSQEFGDFKPTILGMLGTYGFERGILDTAKSLIEDDTYYTMSLLKKGAVHGYAPRAQTCCICNGLLTKILSTSCVRVFNCGHATHLQCEALESSTSSHGSSSGCPICIPSKKSERSRNKSVHEGNGLVKKFMSRTHQAHGASASQHDMDSLDYTYGVQQISRFEMLHMLQKVQKLAEVEHVPPQLRLAPPAVYHEKVKKGSDSFTGESSSNNMTRTEKENRNKQVKDLKARASSRQIPLKSNIFRKEKISQK